MATVVEVKLGINDLTNEEFDHLIESTKSLINKKKINLESHDLLNFVVTLFLTKVQAYQDSKKKSDEMVPIDLRQLDAQRDGDFTDLRHYLRAQLRHRNSKRQEAAREVYELTQNYKDAVVKSRSEQSAAMREFILKCDEKDIRAKINFIGATEYVTNLKESQQAFDRAYLQQAEGKSNKLKNTKSQAKLELVQVYRELYRLLLSLEFFGKDDSHQELLGIFNDIRLAVKEERRRKLAKGKRQSKESDVATLLDQPAD